MQLRYCQRKLINIFWPVRIEISTALWSLNYIKQFETLSSAKSLLRIISDSDFSLDFRPRLLPECNQAVCCRRKWFNMELRVLLTVLLSLLLTLCPKAGKAMRFAQFTLIHYLHLIIFILLSTSSSVNVLLPHKFRK